MVVAHGIVTFFDGRDGKKFGFLRPCDADGKPSHGKDIFFHYNDHGFVTDDVKHPLVARADAPPTDWRPSYPQEGDILVFELSANTRGPKAISWVDRDLWEQMCDAPTTSRPTSRA